MKRALLRWVREVRAAQLDALREMQQVDEATAACASEGAVPPVSTGTGLTPEQLAALAASQVDDWWLDWLMPATLTVSLLWAGAHRIGWLS